MKSESIDAVDLVCDLTRERLTIGGALVLRQEGQMLARLQGRSALTLHLISSVSGGRPSPEHYSKRRSARIDYTRWR